MTHMTHFPIEAQCAGAQERNHIGKARHVRHVRHVRHDAELIDLAARVVRLAPDRRCPERYHEEKSEIVAHLRRLARAIGAGK